MKVYSLNTDRETAAAEPIVWTEGKRSGRIPEAELGEHYIDGRTIRGTGVDGPFRVKGERKPCEMGLLLIDKGKLRSYAVNVGGPHNRGEDA